MPRFRPKILDIGPDLTRERWFSDITAGLIVGIVAIPLAIAFGIASGVTPRQGLITGVVAGGIMAALSGSRVQIGGPTGAFVVLVASIVERFGLDGLLVATMMAGVLLVIAGLLRAGVLLRYIPLPVTTGFTSGIALIIATGELNDAFGLGLTHQPAAWLPKLQFLALHAGATHVAALGVALVTIAIIVAWPKLGTRIPSPFVALVVTAIAVRALHLDVETISTRFGALPRGLPWPSLPAISLERLPELVLPACTIALLAAIESLLSAVVADSMTGRRHRPNTELVAVGIANIASPLFGGIPATGAIARTATNIRSGGTTPIAGITHALTLFLVLAVAGSLAGSIPMATLAGILLVVSWHMSEWRAFLRLVRGARDEAAVLLTTFAFTVLANLTVGIGLGIALAALFFVQRMSSAAHVVTGDDEQDDPDAVLRRARLPADVRLLEVRGPLFFAGADQLRTALDLQPHRPRVLVVDLVAASGLDATTTRMLTDFARRTLAHGTRVIFVTRDAAVAVALRREGLERALSVERAVERTRKAGAMSREDAPRR